MRRLKLSALRLVGFHNYQDVYLKVRGDLFLIGANESGKTTLLDAIQLALSGGERNFVWNASASPSGRRDEGRSLKGVVLRSDLAGVPRVSRGVAWAAVEFRPERDIDAPPVTFLFGASVTAPDARVSRFGARLPVAACDLQLVEPGEEGHLRVLRREEVEARHGVRISGRVGDYVSDLEALFGGAAHFDRVTKLWQLAKSYKDLATRTRRLSDLFAEFLPPPSPEVFRRIRDGFHDVRNVETQLGKLVEMRDKLRALRDLVSDLRAERESIRRYEYMEARENKRRVEAEQSRLDGVRAAGQARDDELSALKATLESDSETAQRELAALRGSEAMGLVDRLRLASASEARQARDAAEREAALAEARDHLAKLEARLREQRDGVARLVASLAHRLADFAPAGSADSYTGEQATALASRLRGATTPEGLAEVVEGLRLLERALSDEGTRLASELANIRGEMQEAEASLAKLLRERELLQAHREVLPEIDGYPELLAALKQEGLAAAPLYRLLEPAPGLEDHELARLEEFLGLPFLATLVPSAEVADRVAGRVRQLHPGTRVLDPAPPISAAEAFPLDDLLCIEDSRVRAHAGALWSALRHEPASPPPGAPGLWISADGVMGWEGARALAQAGAEPRFIGARAREARREREQARIEAEASSVRSRLGERSARALALRGRQAAVSSLARWLDGERVERSLDNGRQAIASLEEESRGARGRLDAATASAHGARAEREKLRAELAVLEAQAQASGALELQARMRQAEQRCNDLAAEDRRVESELAVSRDRLARHGEQSRQLAQDLAAREATLAAAREALLALLPQRPDDLDDYVYRTKQGGRGHADTIPERRDAAAALAERLHARLEGSDGILQPDIAAACRFRIEESPLVRLLTHDGRTLDEVIEVKDREVEEYTTTLREKVSHVFNSLLEGELTRRLAEDRRHVRARVDALNRRLRPLAFGGNRYQIKMKPRAEARWLDALLASQGELAEDARRRLRESLLDRQQLALDGEDDVPAALDYRTWYEFEFRVSRAGQEDVADMALGSGGAQANHNYLLLFCVAANFLDESESPIRLLMMDEAFYGLDDERRQMLLFAAKDLDLDLVLATPTLDGTVLGTSHDSTTVLVEKDQQDDVSLVPMIFTRDENDLFAPPRPEAILGGDAPQ